VKLLKLLYLLILLSVTFACKGQEKPLKLSEKKVKIWGDLNKNEEVAFNKLLSNYEDKNIELKLFKNQEEIKAAFQNSFGTAHAPDIIYTSSNALDFFFKSTLIEPLKDYVNKDVLEKISNLALAKNRARGILYGLPYVLGGNLTFIYNRDYFKNENIKSEDLLENIKKIALENKVSGIVMKENSPELILGVYLGLGGKLYNEKNELVLEEEKLSKILGNILAPSKKYGVSLKKDEKEVRETFKARKALVAFSSTEDFAEYRDSGVNFELLENFKLSKDLKSKFLASTDSFFINNREETKLKKEEINRLLTYLYENENNASYSKEVIQRAVVLGSDKLLEDDRYQKILKESLKDLVVIPNRLEISGILDAIKEGIEEILEDNLTIEEGTRKIIDRANGNVSIIRGH